MSGTLAGLCGVDWGHQTPEITQRSLKAHTVTALGSSLIPPLSVPTHSVLTITLDRKILHCTIKVG